MADYTVRLMRKTKKSEDLCVAELDVEGATESAVNVAAHYARHARTFMHNVRFDYAVAVPMVEAQSTRV